MSMSPYAIAGIVIGGVAFVGILYAVSNSGTASLPPPSSGSQPSSSGGWGAADIGQGLSAILPSIFGGIRTLTASREKTLDDSGYRENGETTVTTEESKRLQGYTGTFRHGTVQAGEPTVER